MCLAIPMELKEIKGDVGVVEMGGMTKEIRLTFIEEPRVGDYLIVHAGFAIEKLDEEETRKTLSLFKKLEGSS